MQNTIYPTDKLTLNLDAPGTSLEPQGETQIKIHGVGQGRGRSCGGESPHPPLSGVGMLMVYIRTGRGCVFNRFFRS